MIEIPPLPDPLDPAAVRKVPDDLSSATVEQNPLPPELEREEELLDRRDPLEPFPVAKPDPLGDYYFRQVLLYFGLTIVFVASAVIFIALLPPSDYIIVAGHVDVPLLWIPTVCGGLTVVACLAYADVAIRHRRAR